MLHSKFTMVHQINHQKSVAYDVALDFSLLSFCDGHPGIIKLAKALFQSGQTVPVHKNVEPMSYLTARTQ